MEIKLQRFFCVIPIITHHDCFYLLNGLVLFSNVSRIKCYNHTSYIVIIY